MSKPDGNRPSKTAARLARRLGLRIVSADELAIRRRKNGRGFVYRGRTGRLIRHRPTLTRIAGLAIPPAYAEVRIAVDPAAHLQAIGRDGAGRWQYRYHPLWEDVREARKARRLLRLIQALPLIRRRVRRLLRDPAPTRDCACAAVVALIDASGIRPGGDAYVRSSGTRGAATLLKANVRIANDAVTLAFPAKGGRPVGKTLRVPALARALRRLRRLPGRRLFQYRDEDGAIRRVTAPDVGAFLKATAGVNIRPKDLRTLSACDLVLKELAGTPPAASARGRKQQVLRALRRAADDLGNTPAVCRRSYVHHTLLDAFENGTLHRLPPKGRHDGAAEPREALLARVVAQGTSVSAG